MGKKLNESMTAGVKTWKNMENKIFKYDICPNVFIPSAFLIISGVVLTLILGSKAETFFKGVQNWITNSAGWFLILVINIVLLFCIYLIFSPFGKLRIGGKDARPEFSTLSWFAMLFSAGMGIGLLFYGVAEPILHFSNNPLTQSGTAESAQTAMGITFLHWGLHPWGVYALVGLALAFFGFTYKLPLSIRNVFYPLLGDKIYGPIGDVIDVLATIATLFGVATSLGIGARQVNAGLSYLFKIPQNTPVQVVLIALITALATWSVVRGLDKGIKFLSNLNVSIALILLIFVLILGPTLYIFKSYFLNIGHYLGNFHKLSTWYEGKVGGEWLSNWTLFYWGWWIAWSPFVGMFIARVSYGRTIRQYMSCVLLIPALITFLWITVFGNSALMVELTGTGGLVEAVNSNIAVSIFEFLKHFPLAWLTSLLAVAVVVMFFVTSSDSASLVVDIITAGGNPDPPKPQRLFWAILEGVVAAVLLVGGGLSALQTAAITTGLPFAVVLLIMCFSVFIGLKKYVAEEKLKESEPIKAKLKKASEEGIISPKPAFE